MIFKKFLRTIILLVLILTLTGNIGAQEINNTALRSEYLLFLEVQLNNISLGDEYLPSYHPDGIVLIPFEKLTSILQLPFEVNLNQGTIEGYIWESEEIYSLDVAEKKARINGDTIPVDSQRIAVDGEDIYLDIELISQWLPFEVIVNPYSAILRVNSKRPLPIEEKIARRFRWENFVEKNDSKKEITYQFKENPYTVLSGPFVDHRFIYTYRGDETNLIEHSTSLSGDFLYLTGRLSINGTVEEPFSELNARLGRRSPDPNLLGPLNAHEIWFGDVTQPYVEDISSSEGVKGFYISSYPYTNPSKFYSHTFEGELPKNWEVELYENGYLIDFQRSNEENRYKFEDIPIKYGLNKFTLVFYDDFGPKYEETKRFQIDSSLIPPDENRYRIDVGKNNEEELKGIFNYGRGITENISLNTNIVTKSKNGDAKNYTSLGLQGDYNGVFWRGKYLKEFDGGQGGEIGFYTTVADTNISIEHALFKNYESEEVSLDLKNRTNLIIRRTFKLPVISNMTTRLELTRKEFGNQNVNTELYNHLSTYYRGYFYKNSLNLNFIDDGIEGDGNFWVYRYLGDYRLRGELGYDLPSMELQNVAGELYGRLDNIHNFNIRINRNLENKYNTYSASVNRNSKNYQVGLNASYTELNNDWKVGVSVSTSYGLSDRDREIKLDTSSRSGAISINTYLDLGDKKVPIEGVGYKINNRTYPERTNKEGIAFISDLRSDLKTTVAINKETLSDPFLIVDTEGISFIPRPGQTFQVDLPLVMTSEIGGYAYLDSESGKQGLSGVEVQILDEKGEIIKSVYSAFDGYFYFKELTPGNYKLQVSDNSIERFNLRQTNEVEVMLTPEGGYFEGFNLIFIKDE